MRIFNWIRNILFVLAIVVILFAASCFIFGLKPSVVMSDSMNPSYSNVAPYAKGSLAIIKKGGPYEVGKPIAFYNGNMFVMHRLVDIQEENGVRYYITKGDANQTEDPARTLEESLVGGRKRSPIRTPSPPSPCPTAPRCASSCTRTRPPTPWPTSSAWPTVGFTAAISSTGSWRGCSSRGATRRTTAPAGRATPSGASFPKTDSPATTSPTCAARFRWPARALKD